ncbi:shikimate kinase [bacterium (Candidatus Moisslbacteria) CG12_big_fil_rev_8_21_14_0_65_36_11]|nr:MAG: shikimate kinase [bacterium (Candidatus Moisslbacteria) CG02_land_8_20_14_3_00_36_53]PIW67985.1 MAG: shikimate kinase [bacterium (Candidatus Moisslbacteria) CG12_big_fil_rev_8_21_14_0_65_36_11]PJC00609.1 MAG: shikimate kinase [bacterium (Candidatus Moisslbacteria) CG_4_9_14_0_8_um_filter_36_20]
MEEIEFMNITLIGMPGAGKTTLGKKIARKLGFKFIDLDKKIEKKFKLRLSKIVDKLGEKKFLKEEEKAVLKLKRINNCVLAPGGSIVYSVKAMNLLKRISLVIFLRSSFAKIRRRVGDPVKRGVIGIKSKSLKKIYEERLPLYKKYADYILEI